MNTSAETIKESQQRLINHDDSDVARVLEAAAVLGCVPGMMSPGARERAAVQLRAMANSRPMQADMLLSIVEHLESL